MQKDKTKEKYVEEIRLLQKRLAGLETANTERELARAEVGKSEDKFRTIFNNAADGILLVDAENKKFYMGNNTICRMLGYSPEEINKLGIMDIYLEKDLPYVIDQFKRQAKVEFQLSRDLPIKRKDGSIFSADVNLTPIAIAGKVYLMGFFHDTTERKKAEEDLKQNERKYRTLLENIPQKIFLKDRNSVFISCNENYAMDLKIKPEEIAGKTDNDFFPTHLAEKYRADDKRVMESGEVENIEETYSVITAFPRKSQEVFINTIKAPVRNKDGKVIGLLGIFRDITDRKKAEEALLANEVLKKLNQMKSEFISTVSHELRTPLSITKEGISLVLDGVAGEIDEKQSAILATAKNNIDRLARIIDNLLDISKIEAGKVELKKELVDIAGLIRRITSSFEPSLKKKKLLLKVNAPEKRVDAYVDPDKLTEVFTNLIGNALKFTDKGYIEISLQEKENEIACFVADTGSGIAEEDLPKIFLMFQQFGRLFGSGEKGTGLGLSITKGIIELHGGKIWVESKLGQGTKINFNLPKSTPEEIFKEYLNNGMRNARDKKTCMTLIVISITEFNKLKKKFSDEKMGAILRSMEGIIKNTLRRKGDVALRYSDEMVFILVDCGKEAALNVENRLKEALDKYLTNEKLSGEIKIRFGSAVYPDEAKNDEELIKKAKEA